MNVIHVATICDDPKHGTWFKIITDRQEVEFRVTRSGLIRMGEPCKVEGHWLALKNLQPLTEPQS